MNEDDKIRNAIDAVRGILEAVPIYQDMLQPAAKEIGESLQTIAKTVHVVLAPVSALVWGYEQIQEFVGQKLTEKLINTPVNAIRSPNPNIAGPAIEALRFVGHDSLLRELYANLLATSMDSAAVLLAHPGFVEIVKQMTPDEAKLMNFLSAKQPHPLITVRAVSESAAAGGAVVLHHFSLLGEKAGAEHPELAPGYLDNLRRLGLIEIPEFLKYSAPFAYDSLVKHPVVRKCVDEINRLKGQKAVIERKGVAVTQFGRQFIAAAVIDHAALREGMGR